MKSIRYSSRILVKLGFLDTFQRNNKIPNIIKNPSSGAEWFHENGQTDMTKLRGVFRVTRKLQ
jgi:hypothetical protein